MFEYLPDNVPIEETTKKSIANCAFTKVKKTKQKKLIKTVTSLAASFAVVFCMLWIVGFENVASAAEKIFYFIPGFGIEEQGEELFFVNEKQVTRNNNDISVSLLNVTTSNDDERLNSFLFNIYIEPTDKILDSAEGYEFDFILKVSNKEYRIRNVYSVGVREKSGITANGIRIFTGDIGIVSGEKCWLTVSNEELGSVKIPFRLVDAAIAENIDIQNIGPTQVLAIKYNAKIQGEKYTVIDVDVSGKSVQYYSDLVYKDSAGNEVFPEMIMGNSFYFKDCQLTENYKPYIKGIYCQYEATYYNRYISIPKDGENQKEDILFDVPHGDIIISKVSRNGNNLDFKIDIDSEYNMEEIYISAKRREWYTAYINYMGSQNFKIGTNEISCQIDPRYDTQDKISLKTNFICYYLNETIKLNFN